MLLSGKHLHPFTLCSLAASYTAVFLLPPPGELSRPVSAGTVAIHPVPARAAMPPPLPDPARFAFCVAAGCAQILGPLLGFAERDAAAGNDLAVAAASLLALAVLAGYLLVVCRVIAACAGAAGNN